MDAEAELAPPVLEKMVDDTGTTNGENATVNGNGHQSEKGNNVEPMEVEIIPDGGTGEKKTKAVESPKDQTSPSSAGPTPKRRKLDKAEKEAERLKREEEKRVREEEKRVREQERLEKQRIKDEEKRKRDEERLRREEEKKRKDEEKEQERLKKEEEKKQRDEEKKRKDEEKEQERLKKEEEKRQRDEEKKRKDEEKEQERLKKEEEKRKRDEEKRKKEEERLKRELEKKQAQDKIEEEKQKQANFMSKFLQINTPSNKKSLIDHDTTPSPSVNAAEGKDTGGESSSKPSKTPVEVIDLENETPKPTAGKNLLARFNSSFQSEKKPEVSFNPMPFQVKTDMALAPATRKVLTTEEKSRLDKVLVLTSGSETVSSSENQQETKALKADEAGVTNELSYLKDIKSKPLGKSGRTEVKRSSGTGIQEDEIEVLYDKSVNDATIIDRPLVEYHFKLLQFHENRRPAYWGTWKTKPKKISARRPFGQEEELDYEFDSDDEWEDEPEDAEELKSEKESDEEEETTLKDADEDDDEEDWMVPHGYLSDDERADPEIDGDKKGEKKKEGGIKICDKDALKKEEEQFYKEIKLDKKLGLPYIQTDNLSAYRMIFFTKKKERSLVKRSAAVPFYDKLKDAKEGRITGLYEGYPSSDEDDGDWEESEDEDEEASSDSDSNYASEDESFMAELGLSINKNKGKDKSSEEVEV